MGEEKTWRIAILHTYPGELFQSSSLRQLGEVLSPGEVLDDWGAPREGVVPTGALAGGAAVAMKLRAGAEAAAAGAAMLAVPKGKPPKAELAGAGAELAAGAAADPNEKPPSAGCDAVPNTTQVCFSFSVMISSHIVLWHLVLFIIKKPSYWRAKFEKKTFLPDEMDIDGVSLSNTLLG